VYNYLEKYSEAIADYMEADTIDPSLRAKQVANNIMETFTNTQQMISKKVKIFSNKH